MQLDGDYKNTDVGIIPRDWLVTTFRDIVAKYIDYRGRTPRKLGFSWGGGDILALSANNVQMGGINTQKEAYFGSPELYRKWMQQGECQRGDVLLTMEAPLGNVAQIPDAKKYILSQRVLLVRPKECMVQDFLAHFMRGAFFQGQLSLNSTGSTAKGIKRGRLDGVPIYFPRALEEQAAIAQALSDTDTLIGSLEKLLEKKRAIKQGTRQELLTGKRRLPAYKAKQGLKSSEIGMIPQDWHVEQLQDVAIASWGNTAITKSSYSDVGHTAFSASGPDGFVDWYEHDQTAVILSAIGAQCGKTWLATGKWTAIKNTIWFRAKNGAASTEYLFHKTSNPDFWPNRGQAQPFVALGDVRRALVAIPPTTAEQEAIATVLSDMDTELAELEMKLNKLHALKQGMMQQLLTGKIRLA